MIKVSHELPLCLLNKSKEWNDYEFCLPTYWFKSKEYKQYYLNARKSGSFIIADNGLFEGDSFTEQQLIDFVNELQPDIFVIPDVWNDAFQSYRNAKYWVNKVSPILPGNTKLMAVIQCTDYDIGSSLYTEYLDLGIKCIAFNHSSTSYKKFFPHENLSVSKMMGRIHFINQLKTNNIIDPYVHHHLLGSSIWLEFLYYKEYDFIKTIDSSFPVILGCEKKHLFDSKTLTEKPIHKIERWFDSELDQNQIECIENNICVFKNLLKGL
jgi:hypothetical protein